MQKTTSISDLQKIVKDAKISGQVGFVPTMGALHKGHLSLIKESLSENRLTVVSIFVNPTQFNNDEDLEKYPRNLKKDIDLIASLEGNIVVFTPSVADMYPEQPIIKDYPLGAIEDVMEGKFRPGHFKGVVTVVELLFEAVQPDVAYFGEKDFQQLAIIRRMVDYLELPIKIVGCPIYREASGLAYSSRNERLSLKMRQESKIVYESLNEAKCLLREIKNIEAVKQHITEKYTRIPDFELEYFEIAEANTLQTPKKLEEDKKYRAFIVVYVENVRLIDNISLN